MGKMMRFDVEEDGLLSSPLASGFWAKLMREGGGKEGEVSEFSESSS